MDSAIKPVKFEAILDIIGRIGPMQWIIILFNIIQEMCGTVSVYFLIFAESSSPSWVCDPPVAYANATDSFNGTNATDRCPRDACNNVTYNVDYTSISTEVSETNKEEYCIQHVARFSPGVRMIVRGRTDLKRNPASVTDY